MIRKLATILVPLAVLSGYALIAGCESDAQTGGLVGAGIGALAGQAIGGDTEGTLIGAAVGGGAGYALGNESDKKKTRSEMQNIRQEINTETVNVTCSNGSVIQVKLRKQGVGYVGPRGEYYDKLPTEDQLRPVYGF